MSRRRRWARRLLIALPVAVVLYALIGFFVVPWAAQRWVVPMVGDTIHGTLRVGEIDLNPFTLSVTLRDAEVTDEAGEAVLGFARFHGNLQASSLFREGWVLRTVELDGLFVHAVLTEAGTLNLATLLKPSEADAAEPWALPRVRGEGIAVRGGVVSFVDRMVPDAPRRHAEPLTFTVGAFDSQPLHGNAHRFSAATQAAERVTWEGEVFLDPLTATGRVEVTDFDLSLYHPYVRRAVPVRIEGGKVSLALSYVLSPAASPRVAGVELESLAVRGLDVTLANRPLLAAGQVEVVGVTADAVARTAVVSRVRAETPALVVERDASGKLPLAEAIEALLAPPTPANEPATGAQGGPVDPAEGLPAPLGEAVRESIALSHEALQPWSLELVLLEVSGAGASWRDAAVSPVAEVSVQDASLTAGPIRSDEGYTVPFDAEATVAQGGTLQAKGVAEPMDSHLHAERFAVRGLDVSPATPYLAQAAPMLNLRSGVLDLDGAAVDLALPTRPDGALRVAFDELNVTGQIDVQSTEIEPPAPLRIDDLSLTLKGLDTGAAQAATVALALKPNGGLITADGTVLPDLAAPLNTAVDLQVRIDRFGLAAFSGYSGRYVAREIDGGAISTVDPITVKLNQGQIDVLVHPKIEDFAFGEKVDSDEAVNLPVGLAVAVLKGPDGTINPPAIPIKGNLSDPSVSVTGLVFHALTNLVTGVVASPFQMLAGAIGGGDADGELDLSFVGFAPGGSSLSVEQTYKLERLAEALELRPAFNVELVAAPVLPADLVALRRSAFVSRLQGRAAAGLPESDPRRADPTRIAVSGAQYREAVRLAYASVTGATGGAPGFESPVINLDGGEVLTADQADARDAAPRRRLRGGRAVRRGPQQVMNDEPLLGGELEPGSSTPPKSAEGGVPAVDAAGGSGDAASIDFARAEAVVLDSMAVPQAAGEALLRARLDAVRGHLVETLGMGSGRIEVADPPPFDADAAPAEDAPDSPRVVFEPRAS